MKNKTLPRRVDFRRYQEDLHVVMLATIGFYDHAIAALTGLTVSQVQYRLRKSTASWQRRQYRMGESQAAHTMMVAATSKNSSVRRRVVGGLKEKELY
jgi:hypothetical protein